MALRLSRFATQFSKILPSSTRVAFMSLEKPTSTDQKKKKPPEIRINLIDNNTLTVMSIESANKLANHKGFQLTPVENAARWMLVGNRKAYQLLHPGSKVASNKDDDLKKKGFKGLKKSVFGANIQEHDVNIKVKQIAKWLANGFAVDVALDVSEKSEAIRVKIEDQVKDIAKLPGTVKRKSNFLLRIQYEPIKNQMNEKIE